MADQRDGLQLSGREYTEKNMYVSQCSRICNPQNYNILDFLNEFYEWL